MTESKKVSEHYPNLETFEALLAAADDLAKGDWERKFVDDFKAKFEQYKGGMYLSEKQLSILIRIQGGAK
jgi:hypothetical protein